MLWHAHPHFCGLAVFESGPNLYTQAIECDHCINSLQFFKATYLRSLLLRHEPLVPGQRCSGGVQHPEVSPLLPGLIASVRAQLRRQRCRCVLEQLRQHWPCLKWLTQ